jgi:hypothetical protein
VLGDPEVPAEERLGGGRPQQDQDLRIHHADLRVEPGAASADVAQVGLTVDPALSPSLPVEVLHHIREVDVVAWDAGLRERSVEQRSGRSDEGTAAEILAVPGLFTDQHDRGVRRAFTEHGLCSFAPQLAGHAARRSFTQP